VSALSGLPSGIGGLGNLAQMTGTREALPRNRDEALKRVSSEFEAIFIGQLLKTMRDSVLETGLMGNSRASKMYREMHDDALASEMAKTGEFGIGRMLYEELKQGLNA